MKASNSPVSERDVLTQPVSPADLRPGGRPLGIGGKLDNSNGVIAVERPDHEVADYLSRAKELCKPE